jgi:hypothetical protein
MRSPARGCRGGCRHRQRPGGCRDPRRALPRRRPAGTVDLPDSRNHTMTGVRSASDPAASFGRPQEIRRRRRPVATARLTRNGKPRRVRPGRRRRRVSCNRVRGHATSSPADPRRRCRCRRHHLRAALRQEPWCSAELIISAATDPTQRRTAVHVERIEPGMPSRAGIHSWSTPRVSQFLDRPGLRQSRAWRETQVAVVLVGRPARVSPTHDVAVSRRRRASSRSVTSSADLHVQTTVTTGEIVGLL